MLLAAEVLIAYLEWHISRLRGSFGEGKKVLAYGLFENAMGIGEF